MSSSGKRNLPLDFLRGVAILLVFGRHLELQRPGGFVGALSEIWFKIGWLGVDLFFVLSGFLIGGLLLTELQQCGKINIGRFLVRRGLKIYPAYFVFLGYLILMPVAKGMMRGEDAAGLFQSEFASYWPTLVFLQNYVGHSPAGHLWTLAVEEHFYLILPFVIAGLAAFGRGRWIVPVAVAALPICLLLRCLSVWSNDPYSSTLSATHLRLDALMFGVAIRGVAQWSGNFFQSMRAWRPWLVLFGIACWIPHVFVEPTNVFVKTIGLTGTFLGSAAFLVAVYNTKKNDFGRWASGVSLIASFVAWIGVYSYTIYLWHVTAMGFMERQVGATMTSWFSGSPSASWLLSTILVCAGAVVAGVLISKIVEWPVLRFRDRFFPSRTASLPITSKQSGDQIRTTEGAEANQLCSAMTASKPVDASI